MFGNVSMSPIQFTVQDIWCLLHRPLRLDTLYKKVTKNNLDSGKETVAHVHRVATRQIWKRWTERFEEQTSWHRNSLWRSFEFSLGRIPFQKEVEQKGFSVRTFKKPFLKVLPLDRCLKFSFSFILSFVTNRDTSCRHAEQIQAVFQGMSSPYTYLLWFYICIFHIFGGYYTFGEILS